MAGGSTATNFRFAVGSEGGPFSSRWSVFSHQNNVYAASIALGGVSKLSLHGDNGSLECHYAFTSQYYKKMMDASDNAPARRWIRWDREPTPTSGARMVASIQFPTDHLRGPKIEGTRKKPLVVFTPGAAGTMVEIGFFYTFMAPDECMERFQKIGTPIGGFALANGEKVYLVGRIHSYSPPSLPNGTVLARGATFSGFEMTEEQKREAIRASDEGTLCGMFFNQPQRHEPFRIVEMGGLRFSVAA